MPLYIFTCRKCKQQIEVLQGYHDKRPSKHSKCGGKLDQNFTAPSAYIGPQTVGSLAEKNSKGFSEDYKRHLLEEHQVRRPKSKRAFTPNPDRKKPIDKTKVDQLNRATKEQKERYIETGNL